MSYTLWLAWRNVRAHRVQSLVSILVVALAIGLSVAVFALADGVRHGILQASDPFGVLVVGPKGSAQQLVINTLLLQDAPLGNISLETLTTIRADPGVQLAVPLGMGDNIGGAPIVGTDLSFFELRANRSAPPSFRIAQGRLFTSPADHDDEEGEPSGPYQAEIFEAVLGSRAAAELKLQLGDRFQGAHGSSANVLASDIHQLVYEVVGVLQPSRTSYDAAVLVPIEAVWKAHVRTTEEDAGLIAADQAATSDSITAMLVQPVTYADAFRLWQQFYTSTDAQAAFPGEELGSLFDLLNQSARVLNGVGYLVLVVAALTVFLSSYSATVAREQAIAVMRSLGSSRANIFRLVIFESLLLTILGALFGRLLGYGVAWFGANLLTAQAAIPVPIRFLVTLEIPLWLLTVLVAIVAGLVPGLMAYRVDVVEKLFPT